MKSKFVIKGDTATNTETGSSVLISCLTCAHRTSFRSCKAFPQQIPTAILVGQKLHTEQMFNDRGIQYEPKFPEEKNT